MDSEIYIDLQDLVKPRKIVMLLIHFISNAKEVVMCLDSR